MCYYKLSLTQVLQFFEFGTLMFKKILHTIFHNKITVIYVDCYFRLLLVR
jgi:hypothetical protein